MTTKQAQDDLRKQVDAMKKKLLEKSAAVHEGAELAIAQGCILVENQAKRSMRDTQVNMDVSYGKHGHHPSLPGFAPAPDSGTLMRSITHDVSREGNKVVGRVGSVIKDPPYPAYLEHGTSRMPQPRPWLMPALDMCRAAIRKLIRRALVGGELN